MTYKVRIKYPAFYFRQYMIFLYKNIGVEVSDKFK